MPVLGLTPQGPVRRNWIHGESLQRMTGGKWWQTVPTGPQWDIVPASPGLSPACRDLRGLCPQPRSQLFGTGAGEALRGRGRCGPGKGAGWAACWPQPVGDWPSCACTPQQVSCSSPWVGTWAAPVHSRAGRQEAEPPLGPPCLGPSVASDASSFESQIQARQALCLLGHQKPPSGTHGCANPASAACTGRAPPRPPATGHLWPLLWGPRVLSLWPCDHPLYVFKAPCFSVWYVRHTWLSQRGPAPVSQLPASCFLCSCPSAETHGTFSHPRAFAHAELPPVRPLKLYSVNKKRGLLLGDTQRPAESIPCPCPSSLSPSEGVLEKLPQSYLPACLAANNLGTTLSPELTGPVTQAVSTEAFLWGLSCSTGPPRLPGSP